MNNQIGSVILILLIVTTLASISSIMVLQTGLSFKKQINISILQQKANEITNTESSVESANIRTGINFSLLPKTKITNHLLANHLFESSKTITKSLEINSPLNGYGLNNIYKTQLIELITNTSSSMINGNNIINEFGCLLVENEQLSKQIETMYSLDLDRDSINEVSYQLDSASGNIFRIDSSSKLLTDLDLDTNQSFSRPQFTILDFSENSKLALAFVVQNIGMVSQTANNYFYLIFDDLLFGLSNNLPIDSNDLIDLNTNPEFSVSDKGYFLKLGQGQLIISAITIFNRKIIFITQSPTTDLNTGFTEYTNKLVTIDMNNDSTISTDFQEIEKSNDLLNLEISTSNNLTILLSSQFGALASLPGECRSLYQYEN